MGVYILSALSSQEHRRWPLRACQGLAGWLVRRACCGGGYIGLSRPSRFCGYLANKASSFGRDRIDDNYTILHI